MVSVRDVVKDYRGLRPLRVRELTLQPGDSVALLGLDQPAAEVLVNLIAGATLPDVGDVDVRGRSTTSITDADGWMRALDEFGILSERAVLLDRLTVEQNVAVPLTLDLYDLPAPVRAQAAALAAEAGLPDAQLQQPVATLTPIDRIRVHLARALAVNPRILLAEHPNAALPAATVGEFAADLVRVVKRRELTLLVMTADPAFAASVAGRVLTLNAASGELTSVRAGWRRWFS